MRDTRTAFGSLEVSSVDELVKNAADLSTLDFDRWSKSALVNSRPSDRAFLTIFVAVSDHVSTTVATPSSP
jgi:hypothetical protein